VFFGRGKGEFSAGMHYKVVPVPGVIKVADFNADASPDLAVLSFGGVLSVLLNRGDGTFGPEIRLGDPADQIRSVALADFNGDRRTDIVTVNSIAQDISVYLSSGTGAFEPARRFTAGDLPLAIGTGDFNKDGRQDLVVVNHRLDFPFDDAFVYRGNGDGTFGLVHTLYAPSQTNLVESTDLNGDGADDLAMAGDGYFTGGWIELSRGDDSFDFEISDGWSLPPRTVTFGDLNGDLRLDLVYTWWGAYGDFASMRLGNGDGTFGPGVGVGPEGASVAIGDFDPDGISDLVSVDYHLDAAIIRPGNGDGTFGVKSFPVGSFARSLVRGDFNADGRVDLAMVNAELGLSSVSVLLGAGDGRFEEENRFGTGEGSYALVAGDFDRDGRPDLAVTNSTSNDVSILLGVGDGTFAPESRAGLDGVPSFSHPSSMALGDFNRDGIQDLAVQGSAESQYYRDLSGLAVLLGRGDGTFVARRSLNSGIATAQLIAADFNEDGVDDLVSTNLCTDVNCSSFQNGSVLVFLSRGDGMFDRISADMQVGRSPRSLATADFNRDGHTDLVVGGNDVAVFFGAGDGTFPEQIDFHIGAGRLITVADFDADSRPDIMAAGTTVLLSNGDGTFAAPLRFLGVVAEECVSGDFNGDRRQDLVGLYGATVGDRAGGLSVLLNTGPFPVRPVSVDVKPGVSPNYVNAYARGVLPVAVLGETDFDASTIDPATVILYGSGDASPAGGDRPLCHLEDVNGDGSVDLLCQFRILDLALRPGEAALVLEAKTYDGQRIRGEDTVRVIGRRRAAAALRPLAGSTRAGLR
jgi:hypothetical protein